MAKICSQTEVPLQFLCLQGLSKVQEAKRTEGFMPLEDGTRDAPSTFPTSLLLLFPSPH
jgi:hypothetical protein